MKKQLIWVSLVIILFHGACVGGLSVWSAINTSPVAQFADRFLLMIVEDNTTGAYNSASDKFRLVQDEQDFSNIFDRLNVSGYSIESWSNRTTVQKSSATIGGILEYESGEHVGVKIQFVKENSEWRVLSITDPLRRGLGPGAWFRLKPSDEEVKILLFDAMSDLARGIVSEDFTKLYENMSATFKTSNRPWVLKSVFGKMFSDKSVFLELESIEPVFEIMDWSSNSRIYPGDFDVFKLEGHYPADPLPVWYSLRFVYEHPDWRLLSIFVEIQEKPS